MTNNIIISKIYENFYKEYSEIEYSLFYNIFIKNIENGAMTYLSDLMKVASNKEYKSLLELSKEYDDLSYNQICSRVTNASYKIFNYCIDNIIDIGYDVFKIWRVYISNKLPYVYRHMVINHYSTKRTDMIEYCLDYISSIIFLESTTSSYRIKFRNVGSKKDSNIIKTIKKFENNIKSMDDVLLLLNSSGYIRFKKISDRAITYKDIEFQSSNKNKYYKMSDGDYVKFIRNIIIKEYIESQETYKPNIIINQIYRNLLYSKYILDNASYMKFELQFKHYVIDQIKNDNCIELDKIIKFSEDKEITSMYHLSKFFNGFEHNKILQLINDETTNFIRYCVYNNINKDL